MAAISGDARRALDICRRSTEVAEAQGDEQVNMMHVDAALKEMFSSAKISAIRSEAEEFSLLILMQYQPSCYGHSNTWLGNLTLRGMFFSRQLTISAFIFSLQSFFMWSGWYSYVNMEYFSVVLSLDFY